MKKFVITGAALVALAVPATSMAAPTADPNALPANEAAPAYTDLVNNNYDAYGLESTLKDGEFTGSIMGEYNSRVTHNGALSRDQAHSPVGRGASVQLAHLAEGKGSLAK